MKQVKIDGQKLKKCLETQEKTFTEMSREIGLNDGYLGKAIKKGCIAISVTTMLKSLYKIDPELYIVHDEVKAEPKQEEPRPEEAAKNEPLSAQKLYAVIYTAVLDALKAHDKKTK